MLRFLCLLLLLVALATCQTLSQCESQDVVVASTELDSPIKQMLFASANKDYVYILTEAGHVWHSYDGGIHWEDVSTLMDGWTDPSLSLNGVDTGVIHMTSAPSLEVHDLVYFQGKGYVFWATRDGEQYKEYITGNHADGGDHIVQLLPNPYDSNYLIRTVRDATCSDDSTEQCYFRFDVSPAQGAEGSWSTMATYVGTYHIGQLFVPNVVWGGEADQVFYTTVSDELRTGQQLDIALTEYYIVVASGYGAREVHRSPIGFPTFLYLEPLLYAGRIDASDHRTDAYLSSDYGESYVQLHFHGRHGHDIDSYTFFPLQTVGQDVSFMDISTSTVLPYGDLYQAATADGEYWRSLPNLRGNRNSGSDFYAVPTLSGVFSANAVNVTAADEAGGMLDSYVKTAFSYNKGGRWGDIALPEGVECSETECSLNLFLNVDKQVVAPLQGDENAVGLLLAHGNVGQYRQSSDIQVYLSRDAGVSWEAIIEGTYRYEMASHGSLFLLTPFDQVNNTLTFSWTQGADFDTCIFTSDEVIIQEIQPRSVTPTDLSFLLWGRDEQNAVGSVHFVDFNHAAPHPCSESEMESFSSSLGDNCLLGVKTNYTRRQRDTACWNNNPVERSEIAEFCMCTAEDYICDGDCFEEQRFGHGTICANICVDTPEDPQQPPENCEGTYLSTKGYRKVEGDLCMGGVDLDPEYLPCPGYSPVTADPLSLSTETASQPDHVDPVVDAEPESPGAGWVAIVAAIVLVLLILVVVLLLLVVCLYKTSPQVRDKLSRFLPSKTSDEDELYQVMGKGGESLLDDDFYNEPEADLMSPMQPMQPASADSSAFSALPLVDDSVGLDDMDGEFDL